MTQAASSSARYLAPQHAKLIEDSKVSPDVAAARGYFTATTKVELRNLGFAEYQRIVPAMVVPVYGVTGEIVNYQIRPDIPRIPPSRDGRKRKPLKYETVAGSRICLDVPPSVRHQLKDPAIPLYVTEGPRKADSAVSHGLCCVSILGVWNWRGTNEDNGKVALADWEYVALNGRIVYLAFDSDILQKVSVHKALKRLKAFLELRGAHVKIIYLPSGGGGAKVGLDDFFAAGHSVDDLLSHATTKFKLPEIETDNTDPSVPYGFRLNDDGVYWIEQDEDGNEKEILICSPVVRQNSIQLLFSSPWQVNLPLLIFESQMLTIRIKRLVEQDVFYIEDIQSGRRTRVTNLVDAQEWVNTVCQVKRTENGTELARASLDAPSEGFFIVDCFDLAGEEVSPVTTCR
jgi:Domain of unknown function (DUF3854)